MPTVRTDDEVEVDAEQAIADFIASCGQPRFTIATITSLGYVRFLSPESGRVDERYQAKARFFDSESEAIAESHNHADAHVVKVWTKR